jgi:hypothetical protein
LNIFEQQAFPIEHSPLRFGSTQISQGKSLETTVFSAPLCRSRRVKEQSGDKIWMN